MVYTVYMWLLIVSSTLFWGGLLALFLPVARKGPLYSFFVRGWARTIVRGSGVFFSMVGQEKLTPLAPYIFMSNHQSYFDVISLLGYLPSPARFVAKRELVFIPLFGQLMWATGHVVINRSRHESAVAELKKAAQKVQSGTSILVFPEGTRSPDHRLGEFKKGGFMLAMEAKVPIVPISITGTQPLMPKGKYSFRKSPVHIVIGEPISPSDPAFQDRDQLMQKVRAAIIKNFPPDSEEAKTNRLPPPPAGP